MSTMRVTPIHKSQRSQAGMVSIMVTMVLMIVISLIVLGFAQISRRNQRQALDRQLSTQAFYAAETGINDANKLITTKLAAGLNVVSKTTCQDKGSDNSYAPLVDGTQNVLDGAANVQYSCLMVDPTPPIIQYSNIGSTSAIVPLKSAGGGIQSLKLVWKTKQNTTTPTANCPTGASGVFSNAASWQCGYGVMRFDLVPTTGVLTAATLQQRTMTSFLVPQRTGGGNSIPYVAGTANGNNRVGVHCTDTDCTMTITGLSATQYYMRIRSIYKDASLQISGTTLSGAAVRFVGAQAVIDATGKAQDLLRRIQVRMPLESESENKMPDYAIESTGAVCKRFAVMDGYFENLAVNVNNGGGTPANPLCEP